MGRNVNAGCDIMSQKDCPNREGDNQWQGSRTYLRVMEAHKRLAASLRHEHALMCNAHAAFRQVRAPPPML